MRKPHRHGTGCTNFRLSLLNYQPQLSHVKASVMKTPLIASNEQQNSQLKSLTKSSIRYGPTNSVNKDSSLKQSLIKNRNNLRQLAQDMQNVRYSSGSNCENKIYQSFHFIDQVTFQKVNIRNVGSKLNVNKFLPNQSQIAHINQSNLANFRSKSCEDMAQIYSVQSQQQQESRNNKNCSQKYSILRTSPQQSLLQNQKNIEYLLSYLQQVRMIKNIRNKQLLSSFGINNSNCQNIHCKCSKCKKNKIKNRKVKQTNELNHHNNFQIRNSQICQLQGPAHSKLGRPNKTEENQNLFDGRKLQSEILKERKIINEMKKRIYELNVEQFRRYYNSNQKINKYHQKQLIYLSNFDKMIKLAKANSKFDLNTYINQQLQQKKNKEKQGQCKQTKRKLERKAKQNKNRNISQLKQLIRSRNKQQLRLQQHFNDQCSEFEKLIKMRIRHETQFNWESKPIFIPQLKKLHQ